MSTESPPTFDDRKRRVATQINKLVKRAAKRLEERRHTLQESLGWQQVNHEAVLLQSNLFRIEPGMHEIVVADWEKDGKERILRLDPLVRPHDYIKKCFRRSKKLHTAIPHAEKQLGLAEEELFLRVSQQEALDQLTSLPDFEAFCKQNGFLADNASKPVSIKKKEVAKPYHIFNTESGVQIWVGRSARDNDRLTFQCANGLDWWLHVVNYPGSHVVVHVSKGKELDDQSLKDAAELALRYSKAKGHAEGEVCLIQVKGVRSIKGTPGKVMLSKHKTLRVRLDETRWERLKQSRG